MAPPLRGTDILARPTGLGPIAGQIQDVGQVAISGLDLASTLKKKALRDDRDKLVADDNLFELLIKKDVDRKLAGQEPAGFQVFIDLKKGNYSDVQLDLLRGKYEEAVTTLARDRDRISSGLGGEGFTDMTRIADEAVNSVMNGTPLPEAIERAEIKMRKYGGNEEAVESLDSRIRAEYRDNLDQARGKAEGEASKAIGLVYQIAREGIGAAEDKKAEILKDPRAQGMDPRKLDATMLAAMPAEVSLSLRAFANEVGAQLDEVDFQISEGKKFISSMDAHLLQGNMSAAFRTIEKNLGRISRMRSGLFGEPPKREPKSALLDPESEPFHDIVQSLIEKGQTVAEILLRIKKSYAGDEDLPRAIAEVERLTRKPEKILPRSVRRKQEPEPEPEPIRSGGLKFGRQPR